MSWVPTTDFEEEVVNLQPDHDFIYGTLSEPQYTYPRPQAHIEYAVNRKFEKNEREQDNGGGASNKINAKLKAIAEVQRMANTKPLGEQPSIDDWDNTSKIEQETVGMMRYHGLSPSVEQPLNEKVTISTFPVENKIKVVKNGRRKMAYYFDDNVFQLKQKVLDGASDTENASSANDSFTSKVGDMESLKANTSFTSSTSLTSNSLSTCDDNSDVTNSFNSALDQQQSLKLTTQRLRQYEKLLEDTTSLSLSCNSNSTTTTNVATTTVTTGSFKSAEVHLTTWKPVPDDDDYIIKDILNNCENWPDLKNESINACNSSTCSSHSKGHHSDINNISFITNTSSNSSSGSDNCHKRTNFLERFIQPEEHLDKSMPKSTKISSIPSDKKSSSCAPKTYACVAKEIKKPQKSTGEEINASDFIPFYTPRKMYALKRKT